MCGPDTTTPLRQPPLPSRPRRAELSRVTRRKRDALDVVDPVMQRDAFIQKRVIGVQKIHDAAVFAEDAVGKEQDLFVNSHRKSPSTPTTVR